MCVVLKVQGTRSVSHSRSARDLTLIGMLGVLAHKPSQVAPKQRPRMASDLLGLYLLMPKSSNLWRSN